MKTMLVTGGTVFVSRYAAEYFLRNRSYEIESYKHSDENRLVLRDAYARELPW